MDTVSGTSRSQELARLLTTMLLVALVAFAISLAFRPTIAGAAQADAAPMNAQASESEGLTLPRPSIPRP
ncbi:MAG: hypothetical protein AABZ33_04930 [Chloroflexota bacterium]